MIRKDGIWKYENPISTFTANILNKGYFYVPVNVAKALNINETNVILFRLKNVKNEVCTSKLSKVKYSKNSYVLKISSRILSKYNPSNKTTIEILQIKEINSNLTCEVRTGFINTCSFLEDFVCFERPHNWLTIHGLSGKTQNITLPHYIVLDENLSWNLGFYLAEGLKSGIRFGVANGKGYLLRIFQKCAEYYFGIERRDWYVDISVAKKFNNIVTYWEEALGVNSDQIHLKVMKHNPTKYDYGIASLTINRKILGELINRLVRSTYIHEIMSNNKQLASAFIRGLEAGDGSVLHHNGCIEPTITCLNNDVPLIVNLFSKIYTEKPQVRESHTSSKVSMVYYRGIDMAREYIINGHFKEHKERRHKLIKLFKDKRSKEIRYLEALKSQKTTKELSNLFNVTYRASKQILKHLQKFNLVEQKIEFIDKGRRSYKTRYFRLSHRGNILLKEISSAEKRIFTEIEIPNKNYYQYKNYRINNPMLFNNL